MGSKVVGLDIGTTAVRATEVAMRRGGASVVRQGEVALPQGAVRDGEVVSSEAVAAAVRELWRKTKFSTRNVVVGVSGQRVVTRVVELPWMPERELRASLRFQAQDLLPVPVDDVELDLAMAGETMSPEGDRLARILMVAAPRDLVAGLVTAVQAGGVVVQSVDLVPLALVRLLGTAPCAVTARVAQAAARSAKVVSHDAVTSPGAVTPVGARVNGAAWSPAEADQLASLSANGVASLSPATGSPERASEQTWPWSQDELASGPEEGGLLGTVGTAPTSSEVIVDVGGSVTTVIVNELGVPRFVRVLRMGGEDVTAAVRLTLGLDWTDAESTKRSVASGRDPMAGRVIDQQTTGLVEEVRGSIDYYRSQSGAVTISRVLVTGGGARLGDLGQRLATALRLVPTCVQVPIVLTSSVLRVPVGNLEGADTSLAVSVGLALGAVA